LETRESLLAKKAVIKRILDSRTDSEIQISQLRAIAHNWAAILNMPDASLSDQKEPTGSSQKKSGERIKQKSAEKAAKPSRKTEIELISGTREAPLLPFKSRRERARERMLAKAKAGKQLDLGNGIVITWYRGEIPADFPDLLKDSECRFYYGTCLEMAFTDRWPNFTCVNCPRFSSKPNGSL
jgi:hypothetical protein